MVEITQNIAEPFLSSYGRNMYMLMLVFIGLLGGGTIGLCLIKNAPIALTLLHILSTATVMVIVGSTIMRRVSEEELKRNYDSHLRTIQITGVVLMFYALTSIAVTSVIL